MIGDKGMTISGGQKQRVSIARALYSQSDNVVLDDPLSSVDAHVSNKLFFEAINGPLLCDRTRLFVINQTQYLPHCDQIIYLKNGKIAAQGPAAEVIQFLQNDQAQVSGGTSQQQEVDDQEDEEYEAEESKTDMADAQIASMRAEAASAALADKNSASVVHAEKQRITAPTPSAQPANTRPSNVAASYGICDLFTYILRGPWFLFAVLFLNLIIFVSLMGHQFSLALFSLHIFPTFTYGNFAAAFVGSFAIIGILAYVRSATVASLSAECFNELHKQLLRRVFFSPMVCFFCSPFLLRFVSIWKFECCFYRASLRRTAAVSSWSGLEATSAFWIVPLQVSLIWDSPRSFCSDCFFSCLSFYILGY